mmetsp:Transcript_18239/g.26667  ORF Transcript_18239/g.26667 Transcript_18239/m.26667 type:complete len:159 (-) Transcript_18239:205-681(-)
MFDDFSVTLLGDDSTSTIHKVANSRVMVIDFWTTKCTRCPAALDKLNDMAEEKPDVVFVSCCLNDKEVAADMVDGNWENMTHIFVEPEIKEQLKSKFAFSQVPYCVVISQNNEVLASGSPRDMDINQILNSASNITSTENPKNQTDPFSQSAFNSDDF